VVAGPADAHLRAGAERVVHVGGAAAAVGFTQHAEAPFVLLCGVPAERVLPRPCAARGREQQVDVGAGLPPWQRVAAGLAQREDHYVIGGVVPALDDGVGLVLARLVHGADGDDGGGPLGGDGHEFLPVGVNEIGRWSSTRMFGVLRYCCIGPEIT
jgi:hypothetical protein